MYNLEEFKNWLNADENRKEGEDWNAIILKIEQYIEEETEESHKSFNYFMSWLMLSEKHISFINKKQRQILFKWRDEIVKQNWDKKIREEAAKMEKTQKKPEIFWEWLEDYPIRKQGLPHWEELKFFFTGDFDDLSSAHSKIDQITKKWGREEKICDYAKIYINFETRYGRKWRLDYLVEYLSKIDELRELEFQKKDLESKLSKKQQEQQDLEQKLNGEQTKSTNLESQLTTVTLSVGLLTKQISELETSKKDLERQKQFAEQKNNGLEKEIKELLKSKAHLEIDNEKLTKNVEELKIQVNQQKDKISSLQGEQKQLEQQLEDLREELNLVPENPEPEKKSLREKILFFNNFLKKTQQEKSRLEENIKEEQRKSQEAHNSLLELEEKLKGTSDDNKQQILSLNQTNSKLQQEIRKLQNNLKLEKDQVAQLQQQFQEKVIEVEKLGITLKKTQTQLAESKSSKPWKYYLIPGTIVVCLLGIGWYVWRKFAPK